MTDVETDELRAFAKKAAAVREDFGSAVVAQSSSGLGADPVEIEITRVLLETVK